MSDKPATEYRIEKAGGLTVYYPIRPTVHMAAKEVQGSCA